MTIKKAIEMIDEYLMEPNSIRRDWVEALKMCRKALVEKKDIDDIDEVISEEVAVVMPSAKILYIGGKAYSIEELLDIIDKAARYDDLCD